MTSPPPLLTPQRAHQLTAPLSWRDPNGSVSTSSRCVLSANGDARQVTADRHARYFGAELDDHSLTRRQPTRFTDWLSRSTAGHTNPNVPQPK